MISARLARDGKLIDRIIMLSIAMTAKLIGILKEYAAFETEVRQQLANICAPHCAVCERVCCRPEYCRETIDSPFLSLLNSAVAPNSAYTADHGWLTSSGCALSVGRPPVCYQFICKKIFDFLPDDAHCYLLEVLSELIVHTGKRAFGSRHLVEIMDAGTLERVEIERFGKRLTEARNALEAVRSFAGNAGLPDTTLKILTKIKPRPTSPPSPTYQIKHPGGRFPFHDTASRLVDRRACRLSCCPGSSQV
jgi:hypothetical protein